MKTFNQFLEILQEKKKEKEKLSKKQKKELTRGIVQSDPIGARTDGEATYYNLNDQPRPVETRPGSPERDAQVAAISGSSGGGAIKRAQKQMKKNKKP